MEAGSRSGMATNDQFRKQALAQVDDLETFAASRPDRPVRPDEGSPNVMEGLCVVAAWAIVDEFLERVGYGGRSLAERLSERVSSDLVESAKELEDVRHLYAQHFDGYADDAYLSSRRRYTLRNRRPTTLGSGAVFDGKRLHLSRDHVFWYVALSRELVEQVRT